MLAFFGVSAILNPVSERNTMKIEMTANETARYWRERRERMAKRVKAIKAKGDWLTDEIEKYQEDLDEILKKSEIK